MDQDIPMCHTLAEAFELLDRTGGELQMYHKDLLDPRVWDLLVTLTNYHDNAKSYNKEFALVSVVLAFCKLEGVRKLSATSFGVPDARFAKPVVYYDIPGNVWGLLSYMTSQFGEEP
jgi:hypothetical protein